MKVLKEPIENSFDYAIFGLGYECRSVTAYLSYREKSKNIIVFGYNSNQKEHSYCKNKKIFGSESIREVDCNEIKESIDLFIGDLCNPVSVLLDITVMTRHRLALLLYVLSKKLPKGSFLKVVYNASKYVTPDADLQPVKSIGPIIEELKGDLGSLSSTTTLVFGLGYEKLKALGVYNYLEPDSAYTLSPESDDSRFYCDVLENNKELLELIPEGKKYTYNLYRPYDTYVDLKSLVNTIQERSRVVLVPLGPKLLSALAVIVGIELAPNLPVWRVSSLHSESPVERAADKEVHFTVVI